jgi:predicted nucleotidyltransferase
MVQLNEIFGNRELALLLGFFAENPSAEFSQTETRKRTGLSKATMVKWMAELVRLNLLSLKRIGPTNLYKLNIDNSFVRQFKRMLTIAKLTLLQKPGAECYLYGSAARGEDKEGSDIDLIFIGRLKREDIAGEIGKLSEKIKKPINFKIFSNLEWSKVARKDKPFYERVEKDKVLIQ